MRARPSFVLFSSDRLLRDLPTALDAWTRALIEVFGSDPQRAGSGAIEPAHLRAAIQRTATFVQDGDEGRFTRDEVLSGAMQALGTWCSRHGCDAGSIVSSFDGLAAALDEMCIDWTREFPETPEPDDVVRVGGRLNRAPLLMAALCVAAYERQTGHGGPRTGFSELLTHELATPLNAAEVAAVLLENDRVTPGSQELRRLVGQIQRNLRRMRALIGDVRDLSTAHETAEPERRVAIGQVLGDVVAEMASAARELGVRVDIEEPVPGIVVPAARVSVILRNLLSNAIKYSDPLADVRWVRISFVPREEAGGWNIDVSDNGLGIPPARHGCVFQRFVRFHPERADGTGLGLAIAHETARKMGADITFESEPGVGSTFRLILPAAV